MLGLFGVHFSTRRAEKRKKEKQEQRKTSLPHSPCIMLDSCHFLEVVHHICTFQRNFVQESKLLQIFKDFDENDAEIAMNLEKQKILFLYILVS